MAIVINGSGTVTGLSVGGLPDGTVDAGTLATNSVDSAELVDGSIDSSHLASGVGGVAGISSSADATAITITSAERIGINHTTPEARLEIDAAGETGLKVLATVANEYAAIFQSASTNSTPIADFRKSGGTSQLKVLADGRGLSQFTAKAWAQFEGDGTPSFRDSHNCSSLTDNATGKFTVNYTNNMANDDYCAVSDGWDNPAAPNLVNVLGLATSSVSVGAADYAINTYGNQFYDYTYYMVLVFGD